MTDRYSSGGRFVSPYAEDERRLTDAKPITAWSPGSTAIMQVQPHETQLPAPIETRQTVHTSAVDRAKAFNISTAGLAAIFGIGGLLIAVTSWGVPLLSVAALTVFFLFGGAAWLVAWLWHNAASPDGIGLISVLLHYRLLRHEQRARLDRIERMMESDR